MASSSQDKVALQLPNGKTVNALAPVIVSASRSTDIPAFYADWFFHRLQEGYSVWINPFNAANRMYISYERTRFIVFWSKNPKPILDHLDTLKERNIKCYIQFTLNDYVDEGYEKNVPPLEERLDTFRSLVNKLGRGSVVWRNDPLMLTDKVGVDDLLRKTEHIGDVLHGYTERLVFSFIDISVYPKVERNLKREGIHYREWTKADMETFAQGLDELNRKWSYHIATCGEELDLEDYGIHHSRCIDDELIARIAHDDTVLMNHLGLEIKPKQNSLLPKKLPPNSFDIDDLWYAERVKFMKDRGQRKACGCIMSKDIGQYNTCLHLCSYCYANTSDKAATGNWESHKLDPEAETIF